jgi:hypothetical protein
VEGRYNECINKGKNHAESILRAFLKLELEEVYEFYGEFAHLLSDIVEELIVKILIKQQGLQKDILWVCGEGNN